MYSIRGHVSFYNFIGIIFHVEGVHVVFDVTAMGRDPSTELMLLLLP